MNYGANYNLRGYLPTAEPAIFSDITDAKEYLIQEIIERSGIDAEAEISENDQDSVGIYQKYAELGQTAINALWLATMKTGGITVHYNGYEFFIYDTDEPAD